MSAYGGCGGTFVVRSSTNDALLVAGGAGAPNQRERTSMTAHANITAFTKTNILEGSGGMVDGKGALIGPEGKFSGGAGFRTDGSRMTESMKRFNPKVTRNFKSFKSIQTHNLCALF